MRKRTTIIAGLCFISIIAGWVVADESSAARFLDLFTAISRNNLSQVQALTPGRHAINSVDGASGATPLTWACMRNVKPQIAAWLIQRGADIEFRDGEGETPLTTACDYGNVPVALMLIQKGADITATNRIGHPPLVPACGQNGQLDIVKALVQRGADIRGYHGSLAYESAMNYGHLEIARYLRAAGAKPSYFMTARRMFHMK
jgi:ankyrin repeat protein